jgi:rRNA maturation endonuclease Nob1
MDEDTRHIWETNRTRKKKPKSGFKYCMGCDRVLLPDGVKCPVCGSDNGNNRFKKKG